MKSIILLVLTLTIVALADPNYQKNFKHISIYSQQHEEKHDISVTDKKEKCDNVEFLNLDNMNLQIVKNDIIRSDTIHHVSLHDNFLKKIPHNILDRIPNLSCFNLSRNNINVYKDNQIRHHYLRVLDLSYQEMSADVNILEVETFEEVENLYKYKHIIFNNSKMSLPNLEYLDLSGNEISTFLWDFNVSFPKLTRLDLINIKADQMDPNFFDKIPSSLRILHLENNYFYNLTLQNMGNITALHLASNPLRKLDIKSTKLQLLALSNCTHLNSGFFNTPYLEHLDLSRNNFDNVFNVRFDIIQSLRVLLLDYNEFSYIPVLGNLQWLNELSLRYNTIRYIKPNSFKNLTSLIKLSLKGNRIDRIELESFSNLQKLEYLDLSENQLSHLSIDWALPLIKLQYLNVNSNQFAGITDMGIYSISSLKHLLVRNNSFTKITTLEIEPLPNYITVYLA